MLKSFEVKELLASEWRSSALVAPAISSNDWLAFFVHVITQNCSLESISKIRNELLKRHMDAKFFCLFNKVNKSLFAGDVAIALFTSKVKTPFSLMILSESSVNKA